MNHAEIETHFECEISTFKLKTLSKYLKHFDLDNQNGCFELEIKCFALKTMCFRDKMMKLLFHTPKIHFLGSCDVGGLNFL